MPLYEYRCDDCKRKVELYFKTYADFDAGAKACPHCQSTRLVRVISRVAFARSEESRFSSLEDDSALDDLADADPATLGRFMRRMSEETGEDLGEEFNEVVGRLERGEDPEAIEATMGLSDEGGGDDFDGMGGMGGMGGMDAMDSLDSLGGVGGMDDFGGAADEE
ncbi:MAG: zinc ribbon domain-containing protein [Anaerolineae bacterium]|nr:zinc ribbon domain-containing protein [Anaerolineae bacterium]